MLVPKAALTDNKTGRRRHRNNEQRLILCGIFNMLMPEAAQVTINRRARYAREAAGLFSMAPGSTGREPSILVIEHI